MGLWVIRVWIVAILELIGAAVHMQAPLVMLTVIAR